VVLGEASSGFFAPVFANTALLSTMTIKKGFSILSSVPVEVDTFTVKCNLREKHPALVLPSSAF
jgi:hypothetical protein